MPAKSRRNLLLVAGALLAAAVAVPVASATPETAGQPGIVGGQPAAVAQYPFAVFLTDENGSQFCGAVLIGENSVATAAHCAKAVTKPNLRVVAGRQDKRVKDGTVSTVSDIWVNPDYTDPGTGNDIALLTTTSRLRYETAQVTQTARYYTENTMATVLGWGRLKDNGDRSDVLRSVDVPMISDASCKAAYGNYDPSTMVCAGYEKGGKDACQGDSGGPLVVGKVLIGIVSWGVGCAQPGKPGVYTRVSAFADELEKRSNRGLF
ncbi:serine protease [Amycolatopsis sp. cg5]|uniref:S1 family serine peptidase n=1 Tax=Amycolatopsis sp. cg5 TaxID=3238802 RepID=UPI00352647E6